MKKIIVVGSESEIDTAKIIVDSVSIEDQVEVEYLVGKPNIPEQEYFTYKNLRVIEDLRYSDLTRKEREANIVPVRDSRANPKINRNSLCPCGSGKKYKKCCCK